MRIAHAATLFLAVPLAWGAGTEPRKAAAEYPVHTTAGPLSIGADYLVRTVGGCGKTYSVDDYLVVEVALYSTQRGTVEVRSGAFTLRLNGKKTPILPQAPGMVAASLKYPDWETRPTVVGTAGVGDIDVIMGRPRTAERFPGDPMPQRTRLPRPPQAPRPEDRSGADPQPVEKPEVVVIDRALPEGQVALPVAGYLYFAHKGKPGSIRSVELLYHGPEGDATLKLK